MFSPFRQAIQRDHASPCGTMSAVALGAEGAQGTLGSLRMTSPRFSATVGSGATSPHGGHTIFTIYAYGRR